MRKKLLAGVFLVAAAAAAGAAARQSTVAPDVWVSAGDSDGDGLTDGFEASQGLDAQKVDTFGDGLPDESRLHASGKTMWEVQNESPAGGGDGGGAGCGATGMEGVLFAAILALLRHRARPPTSFRAGREQAGGAFRARG